MFFFLGRNYPSHRNNFTSPTPEDSTTSKCLRRVSVYRARSALALVILTKIPISHTFFESLIITDYNKFYFKRLKFTVFQKCEYVYKTACLHKASYTPAKISREKTINMAFVSSHIDLQNFVSEF